MFQFVLTFTYLSGWLILPPLAFHILLHSTVSAMDYSPNVVSKRCFFFILKHSWSPKRSWKISHGGNGKVLDFFSSERVGTLFCPPVLSVNYEYWRSLWTVVRDIICDWSDSQGRVRNILLLLRWICEIRPVSFRLILPHILSPRALCRISPPRFLAWSSVVRSDWTGVVLFCCFLCCLFFLGCV